MVAGRGCWWWLCARSSAQSFVKSPSRRQSKLDTLAVFRGVPYVLARSLNIRSLSCHLGCSCLPWLIRRTRLPAAERCYQFLNLWRLAFNRFSVCASRLLKWYLNRPMRRETPLWRGSYLTMTLKDSDSSGCHGRRTLTCIAYVQQVPCHGLVFGSFTHVRKWYWGSLMNRWVLGDGTKLLLHRFSAENRDSGDINSS